MSFFGLGGKMSLSHNVWVSNCLGCQNLSVPKCLVVIMCGCQNVGCQNVPVSKGQVSRCRRIIVASFYPGIATDS